MTFNTKRPPPTGRPPASSIPAPRSLKDALTEAQAIAGGGLSRASSPPGSVAPGTGRKTVMLVDQDATMRGRLRAQLEPFYEVVEACDGMEALEIAPTLSALAMI